MYIIRIRIIRTYNDINIIYDIIDIIIIYYSHQRHNPSQVCHWVGRQKPSTIVGNAYSKTKEMVSAYMSGQGTNRSSASRSAFLTAAAFLWHQQRQVVWPSWQADFACSDLWTCRGTVWEKWSCFLTWDMSWHGTSDMWSDSDNIEIRFV